MEVEEGAMTSSGRASQLICAIDTGELGVAVDLAGSLKDSVGAVKLGLEFFIANGPEGVRAVSELGVPVFLDLKLCDIPNTVAGALRMAAITAPMMITVHATGGPAMMRAAAGAAVRAANSYGIPRPKVLGVTVLTSFDEDDVAAVGMQGPVQEQVKRLAKLALDCGLDGIVASAHEIAMLRDLCGDDFLLVVPGIRPGWSSSDDQKRIVPPAEALAQGADYLVVGRPITRSDDPVAAARRIVDEMESVTA